MAQTSVRIAILNDYEVVRTGLARMLAPFSGRVEVVPPHTYLAAQHPVDVAVYDTFAQAQGHDLDYGETLRCSNAKRLVIYSWTIDARVAQHAIGDGASGYLSKGLPAQQVVTALERVCAGEGVVELDSHGGDRWGTVRARHTSHTLAHQSGRVERLPLRGDHARSHRPAW